VHLTRVSLLAGALATGSLLLPTSVSWASVEVSVTTTEGSGKLVARAVGSDTNVVFVRYEAPAYVITSAASPLTSGPGCLVADLGVVVCFGPIGSATIVGGEGADVIDFAGVPVPVDADGGPGNDALTGGAAANTLKGSDGVDQLTGGELRDDLDGGDDDDWIVGLAESDSLSGGAGDDIVEGGAGGDVLAGGSGRDLLEGGTGSDILQGEAGADALSGGGGADQIAPGKGADAVVKFRRTDQLNCPSQVVGNEIRTTSCAELRRRSAPRAWPPAKTSTSPRASSHVPFAAPVVAGKAYGVLVHVPARRSTFVRRCLRTYSAGGVALTPHRIKFRTRFWPTVRSPRPNPLARTARLTRVKRCRR
jgi:hypothetical protein